MLLKACCDLFHISGVIAFHLKVLRESVISKINKFQNRKWIWRILHIGSPYITYIYCYQLVFFRVIFIFCHFICNHIKLTE